MLPPGTSTFVRLTYLYHVLLADLGLHAVVKPFNAALFVQNAEHDAVPILEGQGWRVAPRERPVVARYRDTLSRRGRREEQAR